jgi:hypothetical protein
LTSFRTDTCAILYPSARIVMSGPPEQPAGTRLRLRIHHSPGPGASDLGTA